MNSWARVGMKVVCVDDSSEKYRGLISAAGYSVRKDSVIPLTKGEVYTIEYIGVHSLVRVPCVRLKEIPQRGSDIAGDDQGFAIERFRPIVSQEDDISMFKSLLKPTEVPA